MPTPSSEERPTTHLRQFQHRLSAEQREALIADYQAGVMINDLAQRYAVSRTTVMKHLDRATVPRRWRILGPAGVEEAKRLYASGQSLAEVAMNFDVDPDTVRRALLHAGVRLRDTHGRERK